MKKLVYKHLYKKYTPLGELFHLLRTTYTLQWSPTSGSRFRIVIYKALSSGKAKLSYLVGTALSIIKQTSGQKASFHPFMVPIFRETKHSDKPQSFGEQTALCRASYLHMLHMSLSGLFTLKTLFFSTVKSLIKLQGICM